MKARLFEFNLFRELLEMNWLELTCCFCSLSSLIFFSFLLLLFYFSFEFIITTFRICVGVVSNAQLLIFESALQCDIYYLPRDIEREEKNFFSNIYSMIVNNSLLSAQIILKDNVLVSTHLDKFFIFIFKRCINSIHLFYKKKERERERKVAHSYVVVCCQH